MSMLLGSNALSEPTSNCKKQCHNLSLPQTRNQPCSAFTLMLDPDQTFNKCCLRAVQFLYLARNRQIIERLRGSIEQLISNMTLNKDYQQDRENPKVMF